MNDPGINSRDMRYFNDVLGKLIRDHVVFEDKAYKGGEGGRFAGCYSVTPRLTEIAKEPLQEYVRFCIHERNK